MSQETEDETNPDVNSSRSKLAGVHSLLLRRSRLYGDYWTRKHLVESARRRDARDNADTAPPSDESIKFQAVWITEVYPLSGIPRLADSIERESEGLDPWTTARALRNLASSTSGGGWTNLGTVAQKGWYPFDRLSGTPPSLVNHVRLSLHMVLPSLAILVGGFLFTEEAAERPTTALRRRYTSFASRRRSRGITLHSPERQKEDEIRRLRFSYKKTCAQWLGERFPGGLFSSGVLEGGRFPACELWTTTVAIPFDEPHSDRAPGYLRVARLDRGFPLWRSGSLPGLTMTEAESDDPGDGRASIPAYSMLLAGQEDQIFAGANMERYGGASPHGLMNRFDDELVAIAVPMALLWTIRAFEKEVADVRDEFVALDPGKPRLGVKRLQTAERQLLRRSGDALPLAADFQAEKAFLPRRLQMFSNLDFEEVRRAPLLTVEEPKTWFFSLMDWIDVRAEKLAALSREVRAFQASMGTALTARTNLSLQRRIELLTWVVGIVTIATLIVTAVAQREDLDPLWDFLQAPLD